MTHYSKAILIRSVKVLGMISQNQILSYQVCFLLLLHCTFDIFLIKALIILLMFYADPNRPGMHNNLIKFLLKLKAPKIVYVSCNPATCARDLDYLCHGSVRVPPTFTIIIINLLGMIMNYLEGYNRLFICLTGGTKIERMLYIKKHTTCRHVSSHSSYRMCLFT